MTTQTQTHTVSDELSQMIDGVSVTVNLAENTIVAEGAYGRKVYPQTEPLRGMSDVDIAQHQAAQAYLDENVVTQIIDGVTVTSNLLTNVMVCDGKYGRKIFPTYTEPLRGMGDNDIAQRLAVAVYRKWKNS